MNIATPVAHGCCDHHFEPDHLHPLVSQLFKPSGVDGVYGRTGAYESVVEALAAHFDNTTADRPLRSQRFAYCPPKSRHLHGGLYP